MKELEHVGASIHSKLNENDTIFCNSDLYKLIIPFIGIIRWEDLVFINNFGFSNRYSNGSVYVGIFSNANQDIRRYQMVLKRFRYIEKIKEKKKGYFFYLSKLK